jgi:SAM-dependent methyltransferase
VSNRFSDYDAFAPAFNRHWGPKAAERLPVLHDLLLLRLPAHATILDLCCGSGHLAHLLTMKGYKITGVDGSQELLNFARRNAPKGVFILADARSFALPTRHDAAICMSDSLNHLLTLDELISAFQNVFSALREGGLFLFDLNMEHKYITTWSGQFALVEDDSVCVVRASYDPRTNVARFDATMFENDQEWRRSDVALFQTWYPEPEVRSALREVGFGVLATRYSDPKAVSAECTDKVYFLCHKPLCPAAASISPG